MKTELLNQTAREMVAPGKGILAADESNGTIARRLKSVGVESTEENRRIYRQLLLTTAGLEKYISGVILFDETIRQKADNGVPFPEVLKEKGILPGIKVDRGAKPFALHPGEKLTEGLDGLRDRLVEYRELGARFAKWRGVFAIEGKTIPSRACLEANAHALAAYAALCQEEELVPIVEPEALMDGDNDIDRCEEVTEKMLTIVFEQLRNYGVSFEGMILKPNMVIAGMKSTLQAGVDAVAEATIRCLRRTVPAAVPGIVFLSGGQDAELATIHLNEMNRRNGHPWELSFSYGRALQAPSLKAWSGDSENIERAQELLFHRAKCNGEARAGRYSEELEKEAA
ncbi:MAG TPA: class I fructose-bisphosphate aldolase [Opitutales bacterium]|nr:class I fructose-bisphosphate aldolase [Opitutales bacterium]